MGQAYCDVAPGHPWHGPYHDREYGFPVRDDAALLERLALEINQAGLSWLTVLKKREAFRRAFAGFDMAKVARFDARRVTRLLADPGIVRHRGKIESAIHNARCALELVEKEGSLAAFFWRFEPAAKDRPRRMTVATVRSLTETDASRALSRELRQRGFRYVGPTTLYALMQSVGIVNDHVEGCDARPRAEAARRSFVRPA